MNIKIITIISFLFYQEKETNKEKENQKLYEEFAQKVNIPNNELAKWSSKYKDAVKILEDRDNWAIWAKINHEKLGIFFDKGVDVVFDPKGSSAGHASIHKGKGLLTIDINRFGKLDKAQMEAIVTHEISHIFFLGAIGNGKARKLPLWVLEGLACYVGDQSYFLRHLKSVSEVEKDCKASKSMERSQYARAWLFFAFIAKEYGEDSIKEFVKLVIEEKKPNFKAFFEKVTKTSWDDIVAKEKEWSADKLKSKKKK